MLPGNSELSSGRGARALAWSHLCACWVLPGCATAPPRVPDVAGGDKGAENYPSVCWLKRENILFLLWRVSNTEDCQMEVCPMASPLISAWAPISGLLKTERPQNVCSRDACSETRLCATTCVLWREAIKCMFIFPGAEQSYAQRLQCPECLAAGGQ